MTIEITSCSKPGIWYEHRIGQRFEVSSKVGKKPHVNGNPLFKVLSPDYKVIDTAAPFKYKYEKIIDILASRDMTIKEIIDEYRKTHGNAGYKFVQASIAFLRRSHRVKNTGRLRKAANGYKQKVWALNTAA